MEKWKSEDRDVLKKYKAGKFIRIIENAEMIEEFDMDLFFRIVEKMIVFGGNRVIVGLLDGTELEVVIE